MKIKSIWIGAVVLIAGIGAGVSSQSVVLQPRPPADNECICPAIYEPVVCKAGDGSHHVFSSLCVAGCNGYTHCARVQDPS